MVEVQGHVYRWSRNWVGEEKRQNEDGQPCRAFLISLLFLFNEPIDENRNRAATMTINGPILTIKFYSETFLRLSAGRIGMMESRFESYCFAPFRWNNAIRKTVMTSGQDFFEAYFAVLHWLRVEWCHTNVVLALHAILAHTFEQTNHKASTAGFSSMCPWSLPTGNSWKQKQCYCGSNSWCC